MKNPVSILTSIFACALASCIPKAIPVATDAVKEKSPANRKATAMASTDLPSTVPANPAGGLRRPDMLSLPDDSEFRAVNNPEKPQTGGAVNVRPPTEPPSRPKPPSE